MKIFLDTANVEDIQRGAASGCIQGVTTNPTIISRESKPLTVCIKGIVDIDPDLTVLIEAVSIDTEEMVAEAHELSNLTAHSVIKLPMTLNSLKAIKILSKEGIRTAVTLVFSLNQAIAASCAGADFIAPFVGRLDDINADGLGLVRSIKNTFKQHDISTQIISASIRTAQAAADLFSAGSDIVTMPLPVFEKMLYHPLTEAGIRKFEQDWKKVPKKDLQDV